MTIEPVVADALEGLTGVRHRRKDAAELVARKAGLYAFFGDGRAWSELQLTPAYEGQPLYVGKAEKSLNGRDVGTHFPTGKTGSSTVRRSLAALLSGTRYYAATHRPTGNGKGRGVRPKLRPKRSGSECHGGDTPGDG